MSSGFVENGISKWRAKKIFLRSDPSGPRSRITTNQTISILICSRIDDKLLCKFSQNVLQKDMLREIDVYDFVVVGPSALAAVGPPVLSGARSATRLQKYMIGYPTKNGGKIWILRDRQKGFSRRPEKVHFWKIQFQNLL